MHKTKNCYNRLKPQSWLDGGFVFQGKVRKRLCKGFLLLGCSYGHRHMGQNTQAWPPHVPTHTRHSLILV